MRTALFSFLLLALVSAFTTGDDHKIKKRRPDSCRRNAVFQVENSVTGGISIEKVEGSKLLFFHLDKCYDLHRTTFISLPRKINSGSLRSNCGSAGSIFLRITQMTRIPYVEPCVLCT